MNTLRLWVVFAIVAPDPIVPPLLMIMSAVMGLRGVCVRVCLHSVPASVCAVCVSQPRAWDQRWPIGVPAGPEQG